MKGLVVLGLLTALAAPAYADRPVVVVPARPAPIPAPMPAPATPVVREQVVLRDVNQYLYGGRHFPLSRTLALPYGTYLSSLVLVASSDNGAGYLTLTMYGRPLMQRMLSNRLEFVQVPVNAQFTDRHEFAVQTSGNVFLAAVGATVLGDYVNPTPTPVPPGPVPPVAGPACELKGYGPYNGLAYNYRVFVNGQPMEATDRLDQALDRIRRLADARVCVVGATYQACDLLGYGGYRGLAWNFRVQLGAEVVDSTDRLEQALDVVATLRNNQLCMPNSSQRCELRGAGVYRGLRWNHLVSIGDRVVEASDNMDGALRVMNQLRTAGVCH